MRLRLVRVFEKWHDGSIDLNDTLGTVNVVHRCALFLKIVNNGYRRLLMRLESFSDGFNVVIRPSGSLATFQQSPHTTAYYV